MVGRLRVVGAQGHCTGVARIPERSAVLSPRAPHSLGRLVPVFEVTVRYIGRALSGHAHDIARVLARHCTHVILRQWLQMVDVACKAALCLRHVRLRDFRPIRIACLTVLETVFDIGRPGAVSPYHLRPGVDTRRAYYQLRHLRVYGPYLLAVPITQCHFLWLIQVDGTRHERRVIVSHSRRTELGTHQLQFAEVRTLRHRNHHTVRHRVYDTAAHLAVHLKIPLYILYGLDFPYIILIEAQFHVQRLRQIVRSLQQIRITAGSGTHLEFRKMNMVYVHVLLKIHRHLLRHRVYVRRAQLTFRHKRRDVEYDARIRQVVLDATRHRQQQHRRYIYNIPLPHYYIISVVTSY